MKQNIFKKIVALAIFCFVVLGFYSCGDDLDGCGLTVVVTDTQGHRIQGANITIGVDQGGVIGEGNTIKRESVSDKNGEAYFFFDNEAIFTIYATILSDDGFSYREGKSTVQLKYDQMITKEVIIP
ncbi:MAG: hypothetical protein IJ748_03500 [Bacteroidales bacterium]|nr:hypothetical protein [Bacteroidales bacterium]